MNQPPAPQPEGYFHHDTGSVRFWVRHDAGGFVGASVRKEILQHCYNAPADGTGALDSYRAHQPALDAAVRRRIAAGSIEPVMLRESDLALPSPG
jgi:hypothetical protein